MSDRIKELEKQIDPETLELLKSQIRDEMQKDYDGMKEELKKEYEAEESVKNDYFKKMLGSPRPWFVMVSTTPEDKTIDGLAFEMQWNEAFQKLLITKKITGIDELDRIENYLIEMLHNIIEQKEVEKEEKEMSEFE